MNKRICAWTLTLLIMAGLVVASFGGANRPDPAILIGEIRQAHNVWQHPEIISASASEAVKLTSIYSRFDSGLPNFFERKVSVSVAGNAFKLNKVDPAALREEIEMFSGQEAYSIVMEMGKQIGEASPVANSQYETVEFGIKNLGLIAILKHISDPAAEVTYLGRTARQEDKIEVRIATGNFIIYADREHRIRRVEVGKNIIEYADYRPVKEVLLPFIERAFVRGQLMYELVFTKIDLNPNFPAGYFSRDALFKQIAH